jgi:hypothetical protein
MSILRRLFRYTRCVATAICSDLRKVWCHSMPSLLSKNRSKTNIAAGLSSADNNMKVSQMQ